MKKELLSYKQELQRAGIAEEQIYRLYMERAFSCTENVWEISEAFSYYNEDKRKDIKEQKRLRKRVTLADVHIATQFFTPQWLCQYLVDNSLGRYFPQIEKEFSDGEIEGSFGQKELMILDPAIGTGNMLLSAYDLLEKEYKRQKIEETKIPYLILSQFYGLDIDKRAVEVAKRLLLKRANITHFDFNIYAFNKVSYAFLEKIKSQEYTKLYKVLVILNETIGLGSIIKLYDEIEEDIKNVFAWTTTHLDEETLSALRLMSQKYDIIIMNPPYLTSSDYSLPLRNYIYKHYSLYRQDLFAVFIANYIKKISQNGFVGVICPYNWMFIKSFSELRKLILRKKTIHNLLQLAEGGYSKAVVYLSAFVLSKASEQKGYYIRLNDFKGSEQELYARQAINTEVNYRFAVEQKVFLSTPNCCMIYWLNKEFLDNFKHKSLGNYLEIRQGMATGNNKAFLKKIEEVDKSLIAFDAVSIEDFDNKNKRYALYNKGGRFRKWFGNINFVIAFDKASREILSSQGNKMPSSSFYFKECITWTLVSSKGEFGARYSNNSVFDVGGSCGFVKKESEVNLYIILGYLCSKVANTYLNALNPTLNIQVGDVKNLPFIVPKENEQREIERLVKENIEISRKDWYNIKRENLFNRMKENEERINEIFIKLFELENFLESKVEDNLITIRRDNEK